MVGMSVARALQYLPEAGGKSERSRGKILQPVVLHALRRKGHVRQRSLKKKKSFVTFFLKSNSPPRPLADYRS
jgi:hypothetical protein